jgi:hypothetical protein
MDDKDFAEVTKKLEEVNKVITTLAPEIRGSAFELFRKYVTTEHRENAPSTQTRRIEVEAREDMEVLERLIKENGTSKPSKNVYLLAAEWYSEYGCSPFSVDTIKKRSESAGLTIPARTDKTLMVATENGKKLFQADGAGFKPTVPGEIYFKATFKVQKGVKTPKAAEV